MKLNNKDERIEFAFNRMREMLEDLKKILPNGIEYGEISFNEDGEIRLIFSVK